MDVMLVGRSVTSLGWCRTGPVPGHSLPQDIPAGGSLFFAACLALLAVSGSVQVLHSFLRSETGFMSRLGSCLMKKSEGRVVL